MHSQWVWLKYPIGKDADPFFSASKYLKTACYDLKGDEHLFIDLQHTERLKHTELKDYSTLCPHQQNGWTIQRTCVKKCVRIQLHEIPEKHVSRLEHCKVRVTKTDARFQETWTNMKNY